MVFIIFILGILIGAFVGILALSLCFASSRTKPYYSDRADGTYMGFS